MSVSQIPVAAARSLPVPAVGATRVVVASGHRLYAEGFARLLDRQPGIAVIGVAHDIAAAHELARQLRPVVLLLDLFLPTCEGLVLTRQLRLELPELRTLLVGSSADERYRRAADRAGAAGYLARTSELATVVAQIERVARGDAGESGPDPSDRQIWRALERLEPCAAGRN